MSKQFACCLALVCALAGSAAADVLTQPNGASIPSAMGCDGGQPTGLAATFACVCNDSGGCNIGPTCNTPGPCPIPTGECETTLWHEFNDNSCIPSHLDGLDPYTDGSLDPETFAPTCPLTFTLLTRGTARFQDVFGWYNVGAPEQLFPMLGCDATAGASVTLDVRNDPRWAGGEIGFFIATPEQHGATGQCAGGDCCATIDRLGNGEGHAFYSQRALNPDAAGADSVIHLVVYDSVLEPRKFYFAWEDIAGGSNNDFTDIVTSVSGVECSGGGAACDTGEPGMCQYGVSACRGSAIECVQVYDAADEACDGADNDCDGATDEDVCNDDVTANCDGVTCPEGEVCRSGACIDPCDHVECDDGEACISGVCVPGCNQCNGAVCPSSKTCDLDSGACVGGDGGGGGGGGDDDDDGGGDDDGNGGVHAGCCDAGGSPESAFGFILLVALVLRPRRRR
jgi:uncharacterized protein (TIGR03382 family)